MRNTVTNKRMLAIGDSITYGFPYGPAYSWVHLVSQQLRIPIVNKGICGETTADMLERFESEILAHRASIVIITGGSNDAYFGISEKEVQGNMREMLRIGRGNGVSPLIGLPPPIIGKEEAYLSQYRSSFALLATEFNTPILDFYTPFTNPSSGLVQISLLVDEVHPNPAGYTAMAEMAYTPLYELLNGCQST